MLNKSFKIADLQSNLFYTFGYSQAFTMAEILISLTIIGVIAAVTLPSLRANINEKTWATQRKALYSRMSQAIALMPNLNGFGIVMGEDGIDEVQTASEAAQAFITDGLSKVLKINNICDNSHLKDCGIPEKINRIEAGPVSTPISMKDMNGYLTSTESYSQINTRAAAFETVNNESILIFYNPLCTSITTEREEFQPTICANFVYDLNGRKGPNKVGKDIGFITAFYSTDSNVVAPMRVGNAAMYNTLNTYSEARDYCKKFKDSKIPNLEEVMGLWANLKLSYMRASSYSCAPNNGKFPIFFPYIGTVKKESKFYSGGIIQCVRK